MKSYENQLFKPNNLIKPPVLAFIRLLLALNALLIWQMPLTGSLFAGEASFLEASSGQNELTIEKIEITGEGTVSRGFLLTTIGMPLGAKISRQEFDEKVAEAYHRLLALSHYKKIVLQLVRGSSRNVYVLSLALELRSSGYAGVSFQSREDKNKNSGRVREDEYAVFGGSRNLADTGIKADLEGNLGVSRSRSNDTKSSRSEKRITGYLIKSNIADSAFYSMLWLSYGGSTSTTRANYYYPSTSYTSVADSNYSYVAGGPIAGWRSGMFDSGFGVIRSLGKFHYTNESEVITDGQSRKFDNNMDFVFSDNMFQFYAAYSQKPNIAAVEPGGILSLTMNRNIEPNWDGPMLYGTAAYTSVFVSRYAVTGTAQTLFDWAHEGDDLPRLAKEYDFSLKFEYVTDSSWVLGVEAAKVFESERERSRVVQERAKAFARYISPNFIVDVGALYGDIGLSGNTGGIGSTPGRAQ